MVLKITAVQDASPNGQPASVGVSIRDDVPETGPIPWVSFMTTPEWVIGFLDLPRDTVFRPTDSFGFDVTLNP